MKAVAVDTNLLLDFRFKREPGFKIAKDLFESSSQDKLQIYIPEIVFAELEWVSRSVYSLPRNLILDFFEELLIIEGVIMQNKKKIASAVNFFKSSNLKFTDCLIISDIEEFNPDEFITSDHELQKIYQRLA